MQFRKFGAARVHTMSDRRKFTWRAENIMEKPGRGDLPDTSGTP
jgi:hypothetical protein